MITQKSYRDWVLGTLVYMVVLSMFNDYSRFLYISSASTIFVASFVLQALTFWTLGFKKWISAKFNNSKKYNTKFAKFFVVWLVLFTSKFVFLWVVDVIFGKNVQFSGFIGLLLAIVTMTVIKELLVYFDAALQQPMRT